MRIVCHQLVQILGTPSNAAQLGEHQALRDSAISETHPQVMERIASCHSNVLTLARTISYCHTARTAAGRLLSAAAGT